MSWLLTVGRDFHHFFTSPIGEPAGIAAIMAPVGKTLADFVRGKFSLTRLDEFSGAFAKGMERNRRKSLRRLSYFQIGFFIFAMIAAIYIYVIAPVEEHKDPNAEQSIAIVSLAILSILVLLAEFWKFLLKPQND